MSEFEKILKKPEVGGTLNHLIAAHEWILRGQGWLAAHKAIRKKYIDKLGNMVDISNYLDDEITELEKGK